MGWGPEAGGPWPYRILDEPVLSQKLEKYANAETVAGGKVDVVTFQPCGVESESSQDRFAAQQWELPNGTWTFTAIFDGHAGHEVADLTSKVFPGKLKAVIDGLFTRDPEGIIEEPTVDQVSNALSETLVAWDDEIVADFLALFPGGVEQAENMPIEEIKALINDTEKGGENHYKVMKAIRGSTALLSLVDPKRENLWVANLGDCQAVLASQDESSLWKAKLLTQNHNGDNENEVARVESEHTGEHEAILNQRVLGAIAVTRALGDHEFKLPAVYTKRIFLSADPGFRVHSRVEDFIARSHTPPYLSNVADIHHQKLKETDKFILLCSDGLTDLYRGQPEGPTEWIKAITDGDRKETNRALRVLRAAIGGDDNEVVSRHMTLELMSRWMDDTTIVVHTL
ncbi:protein serine/threonine phosphatase 2C [Sistotremastrum suecicum HHB10207 ss-3]|uniref:Protein serine/threonine phosphatase 2C n=1 Tax=Sistotremastrum suecicum HHB10207 ss-3 TaxID=1314776 RepID=A0A166AL40_9AGAM|nr:protein serine/threonine phosphatase 2C [Sistotremastrum suecicum HHB10207 ss-3]